MLLVTPPRTVNFNKSQSTPRQTTTQLSGINTPPVVVYELVPEKHIIPTSVQSTRGGAKGLICWSTSDKLGTIVYFRG